MQTIAQETPITQKTIELCQAILDQPEMRSAQQRIQMFIGDHKAKSLYEGLMAKGQALQQKQQSAQQLSGEEIADFEKDREVLLSNPIARGFLDAQEELHEIQHSVQKLVSKTIELGRLPTAEDMEEGSCGHGCGCGHSH